MRTLGSLSIDPRFSDRFRHGGNVCGRIAKPAIWANGAGDIYGQDFRKWRFSSISPIFHSVCTEGMTQIGHIAPSDSLWECRQLQALILIRHKRLVRMLTPNVDRVLPYLEAIQTLSPLITQYRESSERERQRSGRSSRTARMRSPSFR